MPRCTTPNIHSLDSHTEVLRPVDEKGDANMPVSSPGTLGSGLAGPERWGPAEAGRPHCPDVSSSPRSSLPLPSLGRVGG